MDDGIDAWKAAGYPVMSIPPPSDLLRNPSAEEDSNGDGIPDYWDTKQYPEVPGSFAWGTIAHSGSRSLRINIQPAPDVPEQWKNVHWRQLWDLDDPACPFQAGHTYRVRCWGRTDGGGLRLTMASWDANWNYLGGQGLPSPLRSQNAWSQTSWIEYTIPANAARVAVMCGIQLRDIDSGVPEASIWADDFEIQEVS